MVQVAVLGVLLFVGLVLLWWAGDRCVRYAVELTDIFGISSLAVGFIVLSLATGLPEGTTAVLSSARGVAQLSAGDLLGSSLVNLTVVLGMSTLIGGKLVVNRREELSLLQSLVVMTILASGILVIQRLTRWYGAVLLAAYGVTLYVLYHGGLMEKIVKEEEEEAKQELEEDSFLTGPTGTVGKLVASLALVLLGAHVTVDAAVEIGRLFGFSLETLGATVIAVGTGLPELTLTLNAVKRREYALALGDVFGSTLVNLTLLLGFLSLISPVAVDTAPLFGTVAYMLVSLMFYWLLLLTTHAVKRWHGAVLLVLFITYFLEEYGMIVLFYHLF